MGEFETVRLERKGDIAILTLDRPECMNALNAVMLTELLRAIDQVAAGGARCLVLTGSGARAFCTGADLKARLAEGVPDDLGLLAEQHYNPLAMKLATLDIPLVTAINGAAAGAGCSIAISGDISIMARSAYLLFAFVNVGLVPDAGGTWYLAKAVGRARAMEMMLLGERMAAETAQAVGLVSRVVDDEVVLDAAMEIAGRLAAGPTVAIGHMRRQLNHALDHSLPEVLLEERRNQRSCGRTRDFAEAIAGFVEKRRIKFEGR